MWGYLSIIFLSFNFSPASAETYVNRENFEAIQGFHAGMRQSGIGGADGIHGLEEYLATHVVYQRYDENAGNWAIRSLTFEIGVRS